MKHPSALRWQGDRSATTFWRVHTAISFLLNNQHFKHNHKLTTLDIMKNQLTVVSKNSFENLYDLEVLKLSDNKIDFTDKDVPILKTKLKYIDFSWNKIAIQAVWVRRQFIFFEIYFRCRRSLSSFRWPQYFV